MTKLPSINLDSVKHPRVLAAIGGVLLLILVFYLAWWSPEGSKLATVDAKKQQQATQIANLRSNLILLQHESQYVSQYQTYLTFFSSQVPVQPEEGQLVYQLGSLSIRDHVDLTEVSANSTAPATPPATLSTIPVSLVVTGSHYNVFRFLAGIYKLPRLITVQNVAPTPSAAVGVSYNVLRHDSVAFALTISGTAYFSGTPSTSPAGSPAG